MAGKRGILVAGLYMMLAASRCVAAQNPVTNPGFENGFTGWASYAYTAPPSGSPAEPVAGCIGLSPCLFDLLSPLTTPEGSKVCGMQASGSTKNGGVFQTFNWTEGPATLSVTARAYSEKFPGDGGGPWDTGCRVRMGLVAGESHNRNDVASWVTFPWGDAWSTRSISVPGSGLYTLFIESLQPSATAVMSTLWDNVTWTQLPPIAGTDLSVQIPGDGGAPESTARITWTTNAASTSRIDYGLTYAYGQVATDPTLTTNHNILLTGLAHTSTYRFRASSTAAAHAPSRAGKKAEGGRELRVELQINEDVRPPTQKEPEQAECGPQEGDGTLETDCHNRIVTRHSAQQTQVVVECDEYQGCVGVSHPHSSNKSIR